MNCYDFMYEANLKASCKCNVSVHRLPGLNKLKLYQTLIFQDKKTCCIACLLAGIADIDIKGQCHEIFCFRFFS